MMFSKLFHWDRKYFFFCGGNRERYPYIVSTSLCSAKHNSRRLTQGEELLTVLHFFHSFPLGCQENWWAALALEHPRGFGSVACWDLAFLVLPDYSDICKENEPLSSKKFPSCFHSWCMDGWCIADSHCWRCLSLTFNLQVKKILCAFPHKKKISWDVAVLPWDELVLVDSMFTIGVSQCWWSKVTTWQRLESYHCIVY